MRRHRPGAERHDLVAGDVRDAELLTRLLTGVDAVCHQAAMVGHGIDPADAPRYAAHNDLGTATLLAAMHATGVRRLVLASSMVVYGEGRYHCPTHGIVRPAGRRAVDLAEGRYEPTCPRCDQALSPGLVPEDAPLEPHSTYAATKLAQEHLAGAWARQTGGSVWALRYHNVYGPRMPRDTPYSGVASIFRSALAAGRPPRVLEDGRQRRDFVHVTDVATANLLALMTPAPDPLTPVNVCSGEPHTVGELAHELAVGDGRPIAGHGRGRADGGRTARRGRSGPRHPAAWFHRPNRLRRWHRRLHHRGDAGSGIGQDTVHSRWLTARAVTAWAANHHRRWPAGRCAVATSSQTANGSQIRSTSALLSPDRSAASTAAVAAMGSHTVGPALAIRCRTAVASGGRGDRIDTAATARRSAGPTTGPAESSRAARFAQTQ